MIEADSVHSTPRTSSSSSDLQFKSLEEAEEFLKSQGFRLVPDSCNWTNAAGDDAGCCPIEHDRYGQVTGWRVEINRRVAEKNGGRLTRRLMLAGLAVVGIPTSIQTATAEGINLCANKNNVLAPETPPMEITPSQGIEGDPIFAAIERHEKAAAVWDAAVHVWAEFSDGPEPMPIERRIERERINDAWRAARNALDDAGVDLINTRPTTLRGIARALNYIRGHMVQEDGVYMPSGLGLKDDDYPEVVGWIDAFLDTIEGAATELDEAGKAVQHV